MHDGATMRKRASNLEGGTHGWRMVNHDLFVDGCTLSLQGLYSLLELISDMSKDAEKVSSRALMLGSGVRMFGWWKIVLENVRWGLWS